MSKKIGVGIVLSLLVVSIVGVFSLRWYCQKTTFTKAKAHMDRGYNVLAYQTLLTYKNKYVSTEETCDLFIRAAVATADANNIAWVAESCHSNGIEQYSTFMGLSLAQKNRGNIQGAITIIAQSIQKFEKQADPYYLLSKYFVELKNIDQAGNMFFEAFRRAEDNGNLAVESLQFFVTNDQLERAVYVIDKLKGKQINNPEILLLMALGLKRAGKIEDSKSMLASAESAFKDAPTGKVEAIRAQFAELYKPAQDLVPRKK